MSTFRLKWKWFYWCVWYLVPQRGKYSRIRTFSNCHLQEGKILNNLLLIMMRNAFFFRRKEKNENSFRKRQDMQRGKQNWKTRTTTTTTVTLKIHTNREWTGWKINVRNRLVGHVTFKEMFMSLYVLYKYILFLGIMCAVHSKMNDGPG